MTLNIQCQCLERFVVTWCDVLKSLSMTHLTLNIQCQCFECFEVTYCQWLIWPTVSWKLIRFGPAAFWVLLGPWLACFCQGATLTCVNLICGTLLSHAWFVPYAWGLSASSLGVTSPPIESSEKKKGHVFGKLLGDRQDCQWHHHPIIEIRWYVERWIGHSLKLELEVKLRVELLLEWDGVSNWLLRNPMVATMGHWLEQAQSRHMCHGQKTALRSCQRGVW